jgi:hypothetical protein
MAEIQVERKPRSHAGWLLGLLLLVVLLGAGWYIATGPGIGAARLEEGADVEEPPASMPYLPPPPPAPAPQPDGAEPAPQVP